MKKVWKRKSPAKKATWVIEAEQSLNLGWRQMLDRYAKKSSGKSGIK